MENNHELEMDMNDCANYIQEKLIAQGITVEHKDILAVLDLETQWMVDTGLAQPID